MFGWRVMRGE
jgi:hypothetical protein